MGTDTSSFPGEVYLLKPLPNYPEEWNKISAELVLTVVFSLFVPVVVSVVTVLFKTKRKDWALRSSVATTLAEKGELMSQAERGESAKDEMTEDRKRAPVKVSPLFFSAMTLVFFLSSVVIIADSPNNRYAAKRVFHAPLLLPEECKQIIEMAHRAAERNYAEANQNNKLEEVGGKGEGGKSILDEPRGWEKNRHESYPTTDLNVVTSNFTEADREYMKERLDARLSPIIERVYGITPGAIRANDVFVVRYDADGQQGLARHTDSSHVSFNVLLNEDFAGGGTRYHDPLAGRSYDLKPGRGEVLLNNALVLHEGLPVTSGTRYIMVGFLSVDTTRHSTGQRTGLSAFASWLSLPWVLNRLKDGMGAAAMRMSQSERSGEDQSLGLRHLTDNEYFLSLLGNVRSALAIFLDFSSPFSITQLVHEDNNADFIASLDAAANEQRENGGAPASWFDGQRMIVDIDGSVTHLGNANRGA